MNAYLRCSVTQVPDSSLLPQPKPEEQMHHPGV